EAAAMILRKSGNPLHAGRAHRGNERRHRVDEGVGERVDAGLGRHLDAAVALFAEHVLDGVEDLAHGEAGGFDVGARQVEDFAVAHREGVCHAARPMSKSAPPSYPPAKLALYEKLVATHPNVERKGDTIPYTSLNGHMFSYIGKNGDVAL